MWNFMKPPKPIKPVCQNQPTHETVKQLEEYRRYVLASLDRYYKRILEELSVTDPDSLATLNEVINEYKGIENSINTKLKQMEEIIDSFVSKSAITIANNMRISPEYNQENKNMTFTIVEKEN